MAVLMRVEGITGGYRGVKVIKNVSFEIAKGEFIGIIGPNGSGKSTLLRLLSRVLIPLAGRVELNTKDILMMQPKEFARQLAFVPQETVIDFPFTAEEIVLLGRIPHLGRLERPTKEDFTKVEEALFLTDTAQIKQRNIQELSSGERQRVIIAKALAQEPRLLFLDEPTAHLDIGHQVQILGLLRKLNEENKISVVAVMHDLNLASEYCQRLILLDQGSIFRDGTAQEVLTYQTIEAVYKTVVLVDKNPVSGRPYVVLATENN
jgi:iron complex transport system ATP-binding protein